MASDEPADHPPSDAEAVADDQPGGEYVRVGFMQSRQHKCKQECCQKVGLKAHNWYCIKHSGIKSKTDNKPGYQNCKFKGCLKKRKVSIYCMDHARETISRQRRDRELREAWLPVLLLKQNLKCAAPVMHCYWINDGKPTVVCPWQGRNPPQDAMQVDHKKPLSEGGTDDRDNLWALCACCHMMKSMQEQRRAARSKK